MWTYLKTSQIQVRPPHAMRDEHDEDSRSDGDERNVCFICLRPDGVVNSPCNCTNQFVHIECLRKMISFDPQRPQMYCRVCTEPYRGVQRVESRHLNRCLLLKWMAPIVGLIASTGTLVAALIYLSFYIWHGDRGPYVLVLFSSVIPVITCSLVSLCLILMRIRPGIWTTSVQVHMTELTEP
mgnify:CR=1 FL=1